MIAFIIPMWTLFIPFVLCLIFLGKKDIKTIVKIVIVFLCLTLINIRWKVGSEELEDLENNLDILFVIDNSISMVAEDYQGNRPRVEGVKKDCLNLMSEFSGAQFGVILFNDTGRISCPFTTDVTMVKDVIQNLSFPERRYASGSTLNVALEPIVTLLKNSENDERQKILVFISDGEITNGDELISFAQLRGKVAGGSVWGYGTTTGGKMKVQDSFSIKSESSYLKDGTSKKNEDAISVIEEENLKKIAQDIGIPYVHMQQERDIEPVIEQIKQITTYQKTDDTSESFYDTYFLWAIVLCVYLGIRWMMNRRNIS